MPGSAVLETAIGLVLVFALLSLFCSAITEALSAFLQMRAKYLLSGLRLMLDRPAAGAATRPLDGSPDGDGDSLVATSELPASDAGLAAQVSTPEHVAAAAKAVNDLASDTGSAEQVMQTGGLTVALFGQPLLQSLQTPRGIRRLAGRVRNPSYISTQMFTRALLDTLVPDADGHTSLDTVRSTVQNLPDGLPAKKSLLALLKQAQGNIAAFEHLVEEWYDAQMQRISGWYKRWARLVLGIVGLVIAVLANVDTIQVTHDLYLDQPLRQAIVAQADTGNLCQGVPEADRQRCADAELSKLGASGLPVWWQGKCLHGDIGRCFRYTDGGHTNAWNIVGKIFGWLLTAFAVSFGAPFWFESLSKLGSLRSTGPRPAPAKSP
jgi:hypothetical protein